MPERAKNYDEKVEEIVSEDKLSALPDDVLLNILMNIPTREAVSTVVLSKRWRFVWTMLPLLVYCDDDDGADAEDDDGGHDEEKDDEKQKKSVWWFLDQSMELHKAPLLEYLRINLGPRCPTNANVSKWVEKAVDRGVVVLFFKLRWSAGPTILPNSLYTCKTLGYLRLSGKILVNFPSSSCLPSLTQLDLYNVVYKDEVSLVRFLSSCTLLKSLDVKRKRNDNVAKFSVKVPSLVFLSYENKRGKEKNHLIHHIGRRDLVMDTPKLKYLYITDYSGDFFFIENMPCLQYACIKGEHFYDIDKLLRPLSAVSSLKLDLIDKMALLGSTIKFSRLTTCEISPSDSDCMDSLVHLLHNTPQLKCLIVDNTSTAHYPDSSWKESSSTPLCLSSSLEKFELVDYLPLEEVEKLVYYILGNSTCLKTATISFMSFHIEDQETIMETLAAIPRASVASELLFET